jgi:hypothetical protein
LITELSALPIGAGVTAALATVARPKANAVLKKTVLIMRSSFIDRKDHSSFAAFFTDGFRMTPGVKRGHLKIQPKRSGTKGNPKCWGAVP